MRLRTAHAPSVNAVKTHSHIICESGIMWSTSIQDDNATMYDF